ncbi:TIGR04141 family sporadically distributed protein [Pseudoalteromonas sp. SG45-5]|uniref:TIGR04141 family sporadically distributed protein n=1 Tax=unclassified Pseudoalteromonas TaxID=194690 RepID=UPI0015FAE55D|nr:MULTISPECIES: TIGR04141 family sporadically distributed protein [unclassified Pseudoalteromonas]MBB1386376.1 TIGR04141 family sporadically distributed protein [Pseudoalteromonas sp. SG45-5]MBB1394296.1 TIGR04141 family sporadically distributed protein [Pseudoalteromonas sp. SG44-4]MBB1447923.1 TIGR04141 family sporadically distributed protein [Pseudoalteromonas sp. SG41-6]
MKRNVIAFLSKENLSIEELLDNTKQFNKYTLTPDNLHDNVLCLAFHKNEADWSSLFSAFNLNKNEFEQRSVKGVYFLKVENRYMIFTFGYGRALINKSSIERGFGLKVSMNLGDPKQLKSVDKSVLERVARNTRSQVLTNSGIQDFDFEFDHEILKSITAIVSGDDDLLEMVSGNDSVSLYTDVEFEKFPSIAQRLIDAYLSDEYKKLYPWADFIGLETDPAVLESLENILVQKFIDNDIEGFWLAPPQVIDYEDFSGFAYPACFKRNGHTALHPEMDLKVFLQEAKFKNIEQLSISTLKSKYIFLINGAGNTLDKFRMYDALNGEFSLEEQKYILNDGRWYHIKKSFAEEVTNYFDSLPRWDGLENKHYKDLRECCYLTRIADEEEIAVLDQHWVRNKEIKQNYEFCDLMTQCNRLIHVKHYGGSNVFSHLFAQATNGVEMLLNSPEVIPQIQEHLENTYISFDFDITEPRKHIIVLAVIQQKGGDLHLPFFSKVNLRHHARNIQNKGFTVELAKIPVDPIGVLDIKNSGSKCECKPKSAKCTKELTD